MSCTLESTAVSTDHLFLNSTKIAMKMSRVSDKNKELIEEKVATSESDISEEEDEEEDEGEDAENEEASHLYRNSSLGLYVSHAFRLDSLTNSYSCISRFGGVWVHLSDRLCGY